MGASGNGGALLQTRFPCRAAKGFDRPGIPAGPTNL